MDEEYVKGQDNAKSAGNTTPPPPPPPPPPTLCLTISRRSSKQPSAITYWRRSMISVSFFRMASADSPLLLLLLPPLRGTGPSNTPFTKSATARSSGGSRSTCHARTCPVESTGRGQHKTVLEQTAIWYCSVLRTQVEVIVFLEAEVCEGLRHYKLAEPRRVGNCRSDVLLTYLGDPRLTKPIQGTKRGKRNIWNIKGEWIQSM